MWTVYVLRCNDGTLYVGMTSDLPRRLSEHRRGLVRWTAPRLPFQLVWSEQLPSRLEARKRERYLKSGWGKQWLKAKLRLSGPQAR